MIAIIFLHVKFFRPKHVVVQLSVVYINYFSFSDSVCILSSIGLVRYTGVTFAGQVGLLTAQLQNAFTVSIDERDQGFLWENIFQALIEKAIPITFLIRTVVSTPGMNFDLAVKVLSQKPLIADCYLIIGGVDAGQGAVITRNRLSAADVWLLSNDTSKNP